MAIRYTYIKLSMRGDSLTIFVHSKPRFKDGFNLSAKRFIEKLPIRLLPALMRLPS